MSERNGGRSKDSGAFEAERLAEAAKAELRLQEDRRMWGELRKWLDGEPNDFVEGSKHWPDIAEYLEYNSVAFDLSSPNEKSRAAEFERIVGKDFIERFTTRVEKNREKAFDEATEGMTDEQKTTIKKLMQGDKKMDHLMTIRLSRYY